MNPLYDDSKRLFKNIFKLTLSSKMTFTGKCEELSKRILEM